MKDEILVKHMEDDAKFQDETRIIHAQFLEKVNALELKLENVATKDDLKEMLEFLRKLRIGEGIISFTWNNAAKIGSFLLLVVAFFIFIKGGLSAGLAYLFGK